MSKSKHESGFLMIEVAPRPLREDGGGYWCFRCKTDLGTAHGDPNKDKPSFKNACKHFGRHRREMRKTI